VCATCLSVNTTVGFKCSFFSSNFELLCASIKEGPGVGLLNLAWLGILPRFFFINLKAIAVYI